MKVEMTGNRKYFFITLAIVLGLILAFNIRCNRKENLTPVDEDVSAFNYLNQYEQQDEWKNSAMDGDPFGPGGPSGPSDPVWPVAQIPAAANYEIRREIGLSSSY